MENIIVTWNYDANNAGPSGCHGLCNSIRNIAEFFCSLKHLLSRFITNQ